MTFALIVCRVLKEQWVRGKYERLEFSDPDKQTYLHCNREGYLNKQGKDDKKFHKRRFVLTETDGTLKYFNKEDVSFILFSKWMNVLKFIEMVFKTIQDN